MVASTIRYSSSKTLASTTSVRLNLDLAFPRPKNQQNGKTRKPANFFPRLVKTGMTLPRCKFGDKCHDKSDGHVKAYSHPCPYGDKCYRKNAEHKILMTHGDADAPKADSRYFECTTAGHHKYWQSRVSDKASEVCGASRGRGDGLRRLLGASSRSLPQTPNSSLLEKTTLLTCLSACANPGALRQDRPRGRGADQETRLALRGGRLCGEAHSGEAEEGLCGAQDACVVTPGLAERVPKAQEARKGCHQRRQRRQRGGGGG